MIVFYLIENSYLYPGGIQIDPIKRIYQSKWRRFLLLLTFLAGDCITLCLFLIIFIKASAVFDGEYAKLGFRLVRSLFCGLSPMEKVCLITFASVVKLFSYCFPSYSHSRLNAMSM